MFDIDNDLNAQYDVKKWQME